MRGSCGLVLAGHEGFEGFGRRPLGNLIVWIEVDFFVLNFRDELRVENGAGVRCIRLAGAAGITS